MYLEYKSHRPPDMCSPESPFYLGVNRSMKAKYWYKCQPLDEKKLQNLMKDSAKKSNVCTSKKLTNHSGRKTAITRLLDEGMPVTAVQQHTGHKSLESINNYAKNSIKTQKKMCDILDKSKSVNLDSKSKVTKSEKAATAPNPESNPESYINVDEIKTALNERPESTISSTGNRPQPFEFLPKGTVINGGTFNFVFGSNDWDPNKNQKENISPPEPKRRRAMVIYSDNVHYPLSLQLYKNDETSLLDKLSTKTFCCGDEKVNKWKNKKRNDYKNNIDRNKVDDICNRLSAYVNEVNNVTKYDVNNIVTDICDTLTESAKATLGTSTFNKTILFKCSKNQFNKDWYSKDCKKAQREFRKSHRMATKCSLDTYDPQEQTNRESKTKKVKIALASSEESLKKENFETINQYSENPADQIEKSTKQTTEKR
ncbi:unnamed protein product [Mytilus coruscus]|uniref:Tyr recombinase domain-containing protein n=1 Tax=Mytilus coruscus TaxID=42192 RepID=A0A6J8B1S8_MYTCO|nr:unnamed protein product [Mytilus coruscus]